MELAVASIFEMMKCFGPPICKYLDNHRKLDEKVEHLRRKLNDLNIRKQDIESRKEAELRSKKLVKKEVEKWFVDVETMNAGMQALEEKLRIVSYFSRARLGKLVCRKIEEVNEIYERGGFPEGVAIDGPPTIGMTLQTTNLEGEIDIKELIWEYLMGNVVGMIGVCGMGGIGKTTIMKHINNQLLRESRFDKVIWVTVSKEFNVVKVQEDIGSALNHYLPNDELERATMLMDILKRKRFVLILDDVWNRISLRDVGIPEPTLQNGSKLVITSRSIDVCLSMGCEILKVQPLSKQESFNLFLNHVGDDVLQLPALEEIVKLIVDQCGGLPLAIVTIAGSMKGVDDVREWRNALNELRECVKSVRGLDNEIFGRLMFSYDRLGDPKIQECFLYCSLYPEDYIIERNELVEKWIDEKLIDEYGSRQAMRDRGHSILNKLENNCLVEKVKDFFEKGVKMHDVLRDMALSIRSVGPRFMVKAGMLLRELPSENEWTQDLDKVSLMENSILGIPPHISPKCGFLSTLLLQQNHRFERIPEVFFEHMHGLRVLDLSYTSIQDLPNSISKLENLTTLVLRRCYRLRYVPSVAKLRALRKLDLFNTAIEEVPHGMEKLVNLTYLALHSGSLKELPRGILPMLSHLQYLATTLNINGEEMTKLGKLETLTGSFPEVQDFQNYAKFIWGQWPTSYQLVVGSPWSAEHDDLTELFENPEEFHNGINLINCAIGREDLVLLPNDLHALAIKKCPNLLSLNTISLFHEANDLKICYISECEGIECALDLSLLSCNSIQNIAVLNLKGLCNLRQLVSGLAIESTSPATPAALAPPAIFSSLVTFELSNCSGMKKLFSREILRGFQNLEFLKVESCGKMEKIIAVEEDEGNGKGGGRSANITAFILPKLRRLVLWELPELKSISSAGVMIHADSFQYIWIVDCLKLKRISLSLALLENGQPSPPPFLEGIYVEPREWWKSVEWDDPNVMDVLSPFVACKED
ncbi:PREDICTED: probable disease resistance protein At4g27220 [Theobroma cacao]|uniref:Probable disease resistance protein At4g27220 n=1 Tax=Theobroma cacao TaxID=3641 RepID=A0AB32VBG2_THECC|nr:PREDICTED: probable disease resistance protein At4g27220 [Theobroma cacao]